MRRAVILVLLALALPMAAWANGIDLSNQYGGISVSAAGITSTNSHLMSYAGHTASPNHSLGNITFSTGACLTNCSNLQAGNSTFSSVGSSFVITGNGLNGIHHGTIFTGSFVGPITWTLTSCPTCKTLTYQISGTIQGMLYTGRMVTGTTTQYVWSTAHQLSLQIGHVTMGNTNLAVPEPGTLGLLGTGLVGIAGVFRRKFLTT